MARYSSIFALIILMVVAGTILADEPSPNKGIRAYSQQQKLTASDGTADAGFGFGVDMTAAGDIAFIGAPLTDQVYLFALTGNTWTQQDTLTDDDTDPNIAYFGYSLALTPDGSILVIGAPYYDLDDSGAAYVFVKNGTDWVQQQKIIPADSETEDLFGAAVAISDDGNTILIGSLQDDDNGSSSGSAYVYVKNGTVWIQQQKLVADDGLADDLFGLGADLSADGNTAVLGASGRDDNGSGSGAVYVFTRTGTAWSQQQRITASDGAAEDRFGIKFELSDTGNLLVVGALFGDGVAANTGAAYIYARTGNNWTEQQKIFPSDGAFEDYFGYGAKLTADNNTMIVGAPFTDGNGDGSGSAYIYKFNGTSWTQAQKLTANDGVLNDNFGAPQFGMSDDGSVVLIPATGFNNYRGAVYVFFDPTLVKTELIANGDFEVLGVDNKPDVTPWVIKNPTSDKGKCNKDKDGDGVPDKIFANTGNCAFVFKGGAGEAAKLEQNVNYASVNLLAGNALNFSAYINTSTAAPVGKAKVIVKYSDADKTKFIQDITTTSGYTEMTGAAILASANVTKIKVQVQHTATSGKLYVDGVSLVYSGGGGAVAPGLIPLPAVPESSSELQTSHSADDRLKNLLRLR